jgi:hypothetical protein
MKQKLLTETPVCPWERLVIISYTTGLSFAKEGIGPLAAIITTVFYLLALYLFILPNTPENLFASIYSETLIKTTCQHLLLLVGIDTLIYRKYYDTHPILLGQQVSIQNRRKSRPPRGRRAVRRTGRCTARHRRPEAGLPVKIPAPPDLHQTEKLRRWKRS